MLRRSVIGRVARGAALALAVTAASLLPGLLHPSPAHAQGADLTRATCAHLNRLPSGERRQVALWLHGYYTGAAQRPFLDMGQANAAISALLEDCSQDPERSLLSLETGAVLRGSAPARARQEGHIVIEQSPEAEVAPGPAQTRPRPID